MTQEFYPTIDNFFDLNENFIKRLVKENVNTRAHMTFFDLKNSTIHVMDDPYQHTEWLREKYPWAQEIYDAMKDEIDQFYVEFSSNLVPDEHPEWHNFEMASDDMKL